MRAQFLVSPRLAARNRYNSGVGRCTPFSHVRSYRRKAPRSRPGAHLLPHHQRRVRIPNARATFTIDFRHPDKDVLLARGDAIAGVVRAAVRGADVTVRETFHALPVEFSPLVIETVVSAATEQGYRFQLLPSGAFHDAQFVVPVCPTGMIFVPCRKGISHNPAEHSEPSQLAAGTRVLTRTLAGLAQDGASMNTA